MDDCRLLQHSDAPKPGLVSLEADPLRVSQPQTWQGGLLAPCCQLAPACTALAPAGALFAERGTIVTVFIICYALTSFVGGCV